MTQDEKELRSRYCSVPLPLTGRLRIAWAKGQYAWQVPGGSSRQSCSLCRWTRSPRCPLPDGSFPSQAGDDRGKFLHLCAAIHGNGGEPVAFSLLKQMLHRLLAAHRYPGKRWPLFLGSAVSSLPGDRDVIGQLAQFQVRKALSC